jgi:hypothetical protein
MVFSVDGKRGLGHLDHVESSNIKPKQNMSTPIAGTDSTLFEAYLADKIASGRQVCVHASYPHCVSIVYGTLFLQDDGYYLVRSDDHMSRAIFQLQDVRNIGDFSIFLKY